ncbi:MAG: hypothetical protein ACUVQ0_04435 [Thermoproteota archaeon]
MQEFLRIIEDLPAKYADLRILKQKRVQVAFRTDSSDIIEEKWVNVVCRVVPQGYGVASIDRLGKYSVEHVVLQALKQARACNQPVELLPAPVKKEAFKHPLSKEFQVDEVNEFLRFLESEIS